MNRYILGLGSNLNDRQGHLTKALRQLQEFASVVQVSPLFETAPLLPADAPSDWYSFYLNATVEIETLISPLELLGRTQDIERQSGREVSRKRWAPRPLDIDILFNDPQTPLSSEALTLPHPEWSKRSFVISPLLHMNPSPALPKNLLEHFRNSKGCKPALMAIVNATPDSFSEASDTLEIDKKLADFKNLLQAGAAYIDLGAESTRPSATPLTPEQEWSRLEPFLHFWKLERETFPFTRLSLDTYHPQTAERAVDFRVDILNDVNHLKSPRMIDVAKHYASVVLMHSLTVPADKKVVLSENTDVVKTLKIWLEQKLSELTNFSTSQIIFDPGLGFGKTPRQSLEIIQRFEEFNDLPVRRLVGHSRKSYMNLWTDRGFADRDIESIATSLALAEKKCEILRVHNHTDHVRAFKAFSASQPQHDL